MGRSEIEERCNRHPTHKHSNGVCPYCLSDKLTKFTRSSSSSTNNTFSSSTASSTTYYSSYDSEVPSLDLSPPHEELSAKNILKLFKSGRMEVLRKSKSVGFYEEERRMKEEEKKKMKGKKGRFLTKLMMGGGGRRKHKEAKLSHLKTKKEKSSYKWIFFP